MVDCDFARVFGFLGFEVLFSVFLDGRISCVFGF